MYVGFVFSDAGSLPAVPQHSLYNFSHYHFLYIVLVISTHCVVEHIIIICYTRRYYFINEFLLI